MMSWVNSEYQLHSTPFFVSTFFFISFNPSYPHLQFFLFFSFLLHHSLVFFFFLFIGYAYNSSYFFILLVNSFLLITSNLIEEILGLIGSYFQKQKKKHYLFCVFCVFKGEKMETKHKHVFHFFFFCFLRIENSFA